MGGKGSGRHATALAEKKASGPIAHTARMSWAVITATLASAEKRMQKPDNVPEHEWKPDLPPANVLDLARWAVEMKDGKPTQKVDANVAQTVTLDPSLLVKAMRELDTNRAAFMLDSGAHATGCEETTSDNVHSATSQSVAGEGEPPIDTPYAIVPDGEVGWPGASALRNVSSPPEKLLENGGGI